MTLNKICDECKKEIVSKNNDNFGFSEWCVYHFKKRRDFCSDMCFLRFVLKKFIFSDIEKNVKGGLENNDKNEK